MYFELAKLRNSPIAGFNAPDITVATLDDKNKSILSSGKSTLFSYLCIELFSSVVALSHGCNPRILKPYLSLCIHVSWRFDSLCNNFTKYEIAAFTMKGVVRTVQKSCPSVNIFKVYVPYLNPEIQKWINSLPL